jgi:hypothetical protein
VATVCCRGYAAARVACLVSAFRLRPWALALRRGRTWSWRAGLACTSAFSKCCCASAQELTLREVRWRDVCHPQLPQVIRRPTPVPGRPARSPLTLPGRCFHCLLGGGRLQSTLSPFRHAASWAYINVVTGLHWMMHPAQSTYGRAWTPQLGQCDTPHELRLCSLASAGYSVIPGTSATLKGLVPLPTTTGAMCFSWSTELVHKSCSAAGPALLAPQRWLRNSCEETSSTPSA